MTSRSDTKYGEMLEDHDWESDDEQPDPEVVNVGHHHLTILDTREEIERYNGLEWRIIIEDGMVTIVDVGHYCPGPGHIDPIGFVAWNDVPEPVKTIILDELNAESAEEVVDIQAINELGEVNPP